MTVQRYVPTLRAAWDEFVRRERGASVYHATWWLDLTSRCFPHQNVSLLAVDPEGRIRAILPLFLVRGWRHDRLVSLPLRDQAGVLGDVAGTRALMREAVALTRRDHCAYLVLKQGGALVADEDVREHGFVRSSHWVTTELTLPLESPPTRVHDAALRNVRKAERNGVSVELGADSAIAERFYRLFRETRKRLGVPTYSREFFSTLATYPEHVTFILCAKDHRDLAGAAILSSSRKAVYGYAASSLFRRDLRASDLVVWTAINWASSHSLTTFDFGADSPLQTELIRFKQKWGATTRPLHYYYYLSSGIPVPTQNHSKSTWKWVRRGISLLPDTPFELLSRWAVTRVD